MNGLILAVAALMGQCEDGQCTIDIHGTPLVTVQTSLDTPSHGPVRKAVRRVHQRRPLRRLFAGCAFSVSEPVAVEPRRYSTYNLQAVVVSGRRQSVYLHETEECTPLNLQTIEGLALFDNDADLEATGKEMASELPWDVWPDKRKPARRMAVYRRLFSQRFLAVALNHGLLRR